MKWGFMRCFIVTQLLMLFAVDALHSQIGGDGDDGEVQIDFPPDWPKEFNDNRVQIGSGSKPVIHLLRDRLMDQSSYGVMAVFRDNSSHIRARLVSQTAEIMWDIDAGGVGVPDRKDFDVISNRELTRVFLARKEFVVTPQFTIRRDIHLQIIDSNGIQGPITTIRGIERLVDANTPNVPFHFTQVLSDDERLLYVFYTRFVDSNHSSIEVKKYLVQDMILNEIGDSFPISVSNSGAFKDYRGIPVAIVRDRSVYIAYVQYFQMEVPSPEESHLYITKLSEDNGGWIQSPSLLVTTNLNPDTYSTHLMRSSEKYIDIHVIDQMFYLIFEELETDGTKRIRMLAIDRMSLVVAGQVVIEEADNGILSSTNFDIVFVVEWMEAILYYAVKEGDVAVEYRVIQIDFSNPHSLEQHSPKVIAERVGSDIEPIAIGDLQLYDRSTGSITCTYIDESPSGAGGRSRKIKVTRIDLLDGSVIYGGKELSGIRDGLNYYDFQTLLSPGLGIFLVALRGARIDMLLFDGESGELGNRVENTQALEVSSGSSYDKVKFDWEPNSGAGSVFLRADYSVRTVTHGDGSGIGIQYTLNEWLFEADVGTETSYEKRFEEDSVEFFGVRSYRETEPGSGLYVFSEATRTDLLQFGLYSPQISGIHFPDFFDDRVIVEIESRSQLATKVELYRSANDRSAFDVISELEPDSSFIDTDISSSNVYHYKAIALSETASSEFSSISSFLFPSEEDIMAGASMVSEQLSLLPESSNTRSMCYTATATYGENHNPSLASLYNFRDRTFVNTSQGLVSAEAYNKLAQDIAVNFPYFSDLRPIISSISKLASGTACAIIVLVIVALLWSRFGDDIISIQRAAYSVQGGSILVLVLAVLALLSLLATTMASIQSVSRQESARYIENVEVKMLAHMGFERAIAELKRDPFSSEMKYYDEERPSYFLSEEPMSKFQDAKIITEELITKEPKLISIHDPRSTLNGLQVGISGFASKGTYMEGGNVYSLKVSDLQGRIYVNDGLYSYGGNNSSVSQNLKRILNALISHPDLFGEDPKMMEKLDRFGEKLIEARPIHGYRNVYEVLRVLQREFGERHAIEIFDGLKDHITVSAWVDNNVVNPVPLSHVMYDQYPVAYYRKGEASDVGISPAVNVQAGNKPYIDGENVPEGMTSGVMLFRRGRGKNANNEYMFSKEPLRWFDSTIGDDNHNAIYGLDELFPQYIEVTSRAPVNVNTASEAVLTALLTDISGFFIMERRRYSPYSPSPKDFTVNTIAKFQDTELSHTATIPQKYQSWEYTSYSYDNKGYTMFNGTEIKEDGDEYGYLYRTLPLKGSGNSQTGINDQGSTLQAVDIARHIVAAREGREYGGIDYSGLPFSKFDKWSNMHRFFDYLVEKNIIKDSRNIYWNYLPQGWENIDSADWSTNIRYPPDLSEPTQQEYASYAIADALKTNFNPNCHLNEQNPNKNLYLRVDKTDLIINSTEFCFTSMGYFHIESLGRILKPVRDGRLEYSRLVDSGSTNLQLYESTNSHNSTNLLIYESTSSHESTELDVFSTPVAEVSSSKVEAVVKVFDVYRETTQAQFLRGTISNKQGPEPTNNGKGLEIGPEPAISRSEYSRSVDQQNKSTNLLIYDSTSSHESTNLEYDGYIQLSTLGGIEQVNSGPGELGTPSGSPHWPTQDIAQYEGLHVHFQFDKKAHHHASATQLGDQYRDEVSDITLSSPKIIGKIDPALMDPGYRRVLVRDKSGNEITDAYLKLRQLRYNLSNYGKIERTENYYDDDKIQSTPVVGLYDVQRLTKSFRLPGSRVVESKNSRSEYSRSAKQIYESTNSHESSNLLSFAPGDLRLDGAYVERNAGLAYWIDEGVSMFSYGGAISMWVKPSFHPEYTGKTRKLFSYDRWHRSNYHYRNPNMFSLFFVPAHSSPPLNDLRSTIYDPQYVGTRITNKENKPTEGNQDGRGIKSLFPSSLFAGVSMLQATGSLEDWEYDIYRERLAGHFRFHGSDILVYDGDNNGDILIIDSNGYLFPDMQGTVTRSGANIKSMWDKNQTHVIDIETYNSTPSLNSGAWDVRRRTGTNNLEITNSQLEMGMWSHIVWSWIIKYDSQLIIRERERRGGEEEPTSLRIFDRREAYDPFNPMLQTAFASEIGQKVYYRPVYHRLVDDPHGSPSDYSFVPIRTGEHKLKIFIDGKEVSTRVNNIWDLWNYGKRRPLFSLHSFEDDTDSSLWRGNTIRIGETSTHGFSKHVIDSGWARNFSGDFTVDEFTVHGLDNESDSTRKVAVTMIEQSLANSYKHGRYYIPRSTGKDSSDCSFSSGPIYLNRVNGKRETVDWASQAFPSTVLGISATWYAEDYDNEGLFKLKLAVYDSNGSLKKEILPDQDVVSNPQHFKERGQSLFFEGDYLSYSCILAIDGILPGRSVLLSTPVLDDVTLYYSTGTEIVLYTNL